MKIKENEVTGLPELIYPATVKSVSKNVRTNENETEFVTMSVDVEYPNGDSKIIGAILWKGSLDANPDAFLPGCEIELAIQTQGEYAGFAKAQLPELEKFDLNNFNLDEVILKSSMILEEEVV